MREKNNGKRATRKYGAPFCKVWPSAAKQSNEFGRLLLRVEGILERSPGGSNALCEGAFVFAEEVDCYNFQIHPGREDSRAM